jgi:hypothetical protein
MLLGVRGAPESEVQFPDAKPHGFGGFRVLLIASAEVMIQRAA